MSPMKKFFKTFKIRFSKIMWNVNNFLQKVSNKVKTFFKKIGRTITFADKREKARDEKYKFVKAYLEISDPNIDIRYDINLEVEYQKIKNELKVLRKDKKGNAERINLLNKVYKCLPPTRKKLNRKEEGIEVSKKLLQATAYLLPVMVLLIIFSFYPILNSFRLVFFEGYSEVTGTIEGYTFLGNFKKVLNDANFIVPASHTGSSAVINTLILVIITVPLTIVIALIIAVALNSIKPLKGVFQTIFFLPYVTNALAVGLVFAYIFRRDGGLFNQFLSMFGIEGGAWVGYGATQWKAMFVLVLFQVWNGLAFKIMVFISAIQGIDKQYYQAASIDATPKFKQFTRITAPLISPTILYIVITSVIGGFKTYSSVIAIFGNEGAPAGANYTMKTIVFYIYDFFNTTGKLPEAAAASLILFGMILLLTLVQMQVSKKRVHY